MGRIRIGYSNDPETEMGPIALRRQRDGIEQVIANAGLTTYTVSGPDVNALANEMANTIGIDMVAPFGSSLHVAGRDAAALDRAIARFKSQPGITFSVSQASLEDVFISLMTSQQGGDS